ncbi:MAG: hypothetical protein WBL63_00670 [Candidatus Acidiferrum sp.]
MFCPLCKAEYRQGFARCADCDVELVWELPKAAIELRSMEEPGDPNEDPFCSFWRGEDARVHAELCTVLDEARIPHHTVFRRDHLFNLRNYPAYEVGVPFSMFERAETVIKDAYGTDDVEDVGAQELQGLPQRPRSFKGELPETLTPAPEQDIPGPPSTGGETDWYPEDATVRVWRTESGEPCEFLVAALHENGIRCRNEQSGNKAELYVLPEDQDRAREIVREIVEGQPPE